MFEYELFDLGSAFNQANGKLARLTADGWEPLGFQVTTPGHYIVMARREVVFQAEPEPAKPARAKK